MATATREAYGKTLAKLIVEHDDLFVLDADLTKSTKTIEAKKARPEHHFNMGIAEGNMMAVAAGMAASNKVVYASSFAMFAAGRAFEQIRNSICYPNLNVKVCATHAGITVGEDGASHQCIEDIGRDLDYNRKNWNKLLEDIMENKVKTIVISNKDRFVRFGYDWFEKLCEKFNTQIIIVNNETFSPNKELVEDIVSILDMFSSELYGLRKYKNQIKGDEQIAKGLQDRDKSNARTKDKD